MIIQDSGSVAISTPTGPMQSAVFSPVANGCYPGVVLFSEIFQITGPMRRLAATIASHGYIVVIPEIYHEFEPAGTILSYDKDGAARGNELKVEKELSSFDADARAALSYLESHPNCNRKLGVVGFCIGGHLSFRAAMNTQVLAGVCFYGTDIHKRGLGKGMNDDSLNRVGEIKGEMLMIWGRQDPHIPSEGRALIYQTMTDADVKFTWHEFNAQHAFMRDEGARYDPEISLLCQQLMLSLFKRKLSDGDLPRD